MQSRSTPIAVGLGVAVAVLVAPAAQACRLGHTSLFLPSLPVERYGADFIAEVVVVKDDATADPRTRRVTLDVLSSDTHPALKGQVVVADYGLDACGPEPTLDARGIVVGKTPKGDGESDAVARLFRVHNVAPSLITDDGRLPFVAE